jgi:RNA polymerase sigma factor (sigma-70 family)
MSAKRFGTETNRRAGIPQGLSAVFVEHQSALKRFIAKFFSRPQDVDDIAQETFLRAFCAERGGDALRAPKAFLFHVAKNVALNELTRKSRMLTDYIEDSISLDVIGEGESAEDCVLAQEKLSMFCSAVATLPMQCRRAFLMRKVYGFSHKEISDRMGISVSTVEKHVASGLLRCSTFLREVGHSVDLVAPLEAERDKHRAVE